MLAHDGGAANIKINYRWVHPVRMSNTRMCFGLGLGRICGRLHMSLTLAWFISNRHLVCCRPYDWGVNTADY
jgi:hypothetical protein